MARLWCTRPRASSSAAWISGSSARRASRRSTLRARISRAVRSAPRLWFGSASAKISVRKLATAAALASPRRARSRSSSSRTLFQARIPTMARIAAEAATTDRWCRRRKLAEAVAEGGRAGQDRPPLQVPGQVVGQVPPASRSDRSHPGPGPSRGCCPGRGPASRRRRYRRRPGSERPASRSRSRGTAPPGCSFGRRKPSGRSARDRPPVRARRHRWPW